MTDRAVQKVLKNLLELQIIDIHRRRDGQTNLSNAYRLNFGGTFELVRQAPKQPIPGMTPPGRPFGGPQLLLSGLEKGGEPGTPGTSRSPGGEPGTPGVVNVGHQGGEPGTPGVVNVGHQGGERGTPPLVNVGHQVVNVGHPNLSPGNTSPSPLRGSPPVVASVALDEPTDRVVRFAAPHRRAAKLLSVARRRGFAPEAPGRVRKPVTVRRSTPAPATQPEPRTTLVHRIGLERFDPSKLLIQEWFSEVNGITLGEVPWGKAEDQALLDMLKAEPHLNHDQLRQRLVHRYAAIEIGERKPQRSSVGRRNPLTQVMKQLPMFADGPVNVFGDRLGGVV